MGGKVSNPHPYPLGQHVVCIPAPTCIGLRLGRAARAKTGWGKRVVLAMGDLHFSNEGQMPVSTARDREARTLTRVERAAGVLFNAGTTDRWGMVCVPGCLTDEAGMR